MAKKKSKAKASQPESEKITHQFTLKEMDAHETKLLIEGAADERNAILRVLMRQRLNLKQLIEVMPEEDIPMLESLWGLRDSIDFAINVVKSTPSYEERIFDWSDIDWSPIDEIRG